MSDELLKEIKGSLLEGIDKEQLNHHVPKGYFENLTNEIIRINENEARGVSFPQLMWIGIAASISIILGFMVCMHESPSSKNIFQNADDDTLIQYAALDMDLSDLTYEELIGENTFPGFENLDDDIMDSYIENHTDITELEEILDYL